MEEDDVKSKGEIYPWALGDGWRTEYKSFLRRRDMFWKKMNFSAFVSMPCCQEVTSLPNLIKSPLLMIEGIRNIAFSIFVIITSYGNPPHLVFFKSTIKITC